MRRYLLDTTPVAALLRNRPAATAMIRPWVQDHEAATSIIVYGEVLEYLKRFPDSVRRQADLRLLVGEVYPYFLTYPVMERYSELRRQLRPPHGPGLIGDLDTLIAATALVRKLILVTTDRDFTRVPGLQLLLIDRAALASRVGSDD